MRFPLEADLLGFLRPLRSPSVKSAGIKDGEFNSIAAFNIAKGDYDAASDGGYDTSYKAESVEAFFVLQLAKTAGPGSEVFMDDMKNTRAKDIRVVAYLQDLCGAKNLPFENYRLLQDVLTRTPDFIPYYLAFTRTMYPTEFGRRVSYLRTVFQSAVKVGAMDESAAAALCQDALTRVQQMVYGIF